MGKEEGAAKPQEPAKGEEKKKLKPCCACPETKSVRDECSSLFWELLWYIVHTAAKSPLPKMDGSDEYGGRYPRTRGQKRKSDDLGAAAKSACPTPIAPHPKTLCKTVRKTALTSSKLIASACAISVSTSESVCRRNPLMSSTTSRQRAEPPRARSGHVCTREQSE